LLKEQYPNLHLVIPTVAQMEYEVRQVVSQIQYPAFVLLNPDDKWDEFAACNVALAVSGTVGLELAYMGVPHVITYKMHPVSWFLVKLLVKTKYAHLANILLNEPAVPEYLQGKANSVEIGKGLLKLFKDENERKAQLEKTSKLAAMLTADPDKAPSDMAADFVIEVSRDKAKKLQGRDAQVSVGDAAKAIASKIPTAQKTKLKSSKKPATKAKPKAEKKSA
jgi:lipid-A-disaccharide synthase